jgi:hypothetical protein
MRELREGMRVRSKNLGLATILNRCSCGCGGWMVETKRGVAWSCVEDGLVPLDGDTERETDMETKLTTYSYEVLVVEKRDEEGAVVRGPQQIARASELLECPTREDLLMQYAKEIAAVGAKASEVVVNIVPFAR